MFTIVARFDAINPENRTKKIVERTETKKPKPVHVVQHKEAV